MEDKLKKNIKKSKQIFQSQKVSGEELWSGPPWEALRHLAMHLQQLRRASAPGRGPDQGQLVPGWGGCGGSGSPGRTRLLLPGTNLRLAGWGSSSEPSSLPPSSLPPRSPARWCYSNGHNTCPQATPLH